MRTTKREMNFYSIYDRAGLEKHLEEMAAKGWMLDKIGQYLWYYRRSEPRNIRFAVSYFPSASVFDPAPSEKQETYREFCEHSGWKLAGASAQLEVYWNEDENAVPLATDPLVEIQTIHKTAIKTVILSNVLLLLIVIMNLVRSVQFYYRNTIDSLLSDSNFWITIAMAFAGVFCIMELVRYFAWYFKAKKMAECEERFFTPKRTIQFTTGMITVFLVLFVIGFLSFALDESMLVGAIIIGYTLLIFAIVYGIKYVLKVKKASTNVNRTVTLISCFVVSMIVTSAATFLIFRNADITEQEAHKVVGTYEHAGWNFEVYADEIPLYIEDFTYVEDVEYYYYKEVEESSALKQVSARQEKVGYEVEAPELSYAIIDVKIPALYDNCVDYFLREASRYNDEIEYREIQDESWEANTVYRLYEGSEYMDTYLLCYENRIVRVSLYDYDMENNPATAKIISEKVKPN